MFSVVSVVNHWSQGMTRVIARRRGHGRWLVLVPGWGTDDRIFASLDLPYDYLSVARLEPETFDGDLSAALADGGIDRVTLLGWSMGGLAAAQFAQRHPGAVERLVMVAVRPQFPADLLKLMRNGIRRNPQGRLMRFFHDCFARGEEELRERFRAEIMPRYTDEPDMDFLYAGLDYLAAARLEPEELGDVPVTVIHGRQDVIAPVEEISACRYRFRRAAWSIADGGHMPFLRPDFAARLHATADHR